MRLKFKVHENHGSAYRDPVSRCKARKRERSRHCLV